MLTDAIAQIPASHGRVILVRADSAGASHQLLDWLTAPGRARGRQVEYSIGFPVNEGIAVHDAIHSLPEPAWTAAVDADGEIRDGARQASDADLTATITAIHAESKGRYGVPRIHATLLRRGQRVSKKRVAKLMRTAGLRGRTPKRWRKTTVPDPAATVPVDLIRRDFAVDAAQINTRCCGDITYINTWQGWLYLATVLDVRSRRVVGYAMADHLRTDLIADALNNAVAGRNPDPGVVFHSDTAANTRPGSTPSSPRTARSRCRSGGPGSAGTTPSPNRSSPR